MAATIGGTRPGASGDGFAAATRLVLVASLRGAASARDAAELLRRRRRRARADGADLHPPVAGASRRLPPAPARPAAAALAAVDGDAAGALEAELVALARRAGRPGAGTIAIPAVYAEAIAPRR
jgi:hypothetical protein